MKKLTRLSLGDNKISDVSSISGLNELKTLFLNWNQIDEINIKLEKLEDLFIEENNLTTLCNLYAPSLINIKAKNNKIQDINCLANWKNLKTIRLTRNPIKYFDDFLNKENPPYLKIDWENIGNIDRFEGTAFERYLPETKSYFAYYYYAFLVSLIVLWYFIRKKIGFDYFSLLMLLPSFSLLGIFLALNEVISSLSYKFDMYNIIWYQVTFTLLVAFYSLIIHKRKGSILIILPLFIITTLLLVLIFGVMSSVSMIG